MTDQDAPVSFADDYQDNEVDKFFETKGGETEPEITENDNQQEREKPQQEIVAEKDTVQDDDEPNDVITKEEPVAKDQERYRAMAEEERIKRKEIQKQIDTMREENDKLKNTFNRILTKAQEQANAETAAQVPSFEDDPIAALKYENDRLRHDFEGVKKYNEQQQQQSETQQRQAEFVNVYRTKSEEFKRTNPDFDDAYNHLMNSRLEEFTTAGYTDKEARQLILEDEAAIVATALTKGNNPAESIYKIAKLRGYQGKSNINAQQKINENEEKIQTLERGLRASKSVNSGGINAKESLSLEDIARMDDDEFDNVDWNKVLKMG